VAPVVKRPSHPIHEVTPMRNLAVIILVLLVAIGILGYYEGWFTVSEKDGKTNLQFDKNKFKDDMNLFQTKMSEEVGTLKDNIAGLFKKSEKLKGDEKTQVQADLHNLDMDREKLEKQIRALSDAAQPDIASIKEDLTKKLQDVNKKIAELTKKLG
jgi:chromosome segregation ATPase